MNSILLLEKTSFNVCISFLLLGWTYSVIALISSLWYPNIVYNYLMSTYSLCYIKRISYYAMKYVQLEFNSQSRLPVVLITGICISIDLTNYL